MSRLRFAPGALSRAGRTEAMATLVLVAFGLFLRLGGVVLGDPIGFWNDEANWAIRVMNDPLQKLAIRPIGFMLLTRWSVTLLGHWEFSFRLLPWLAGLATPLVAVLLARRFLNRAAARLLFIGILSLSPLAIDYSKEFKPYALSLLLHLLLPLLVLRWHDTRRMRDLVLAGLVAPLGVFFAQDVIFLYPGLFLVLGVESWRKRNFRQLSVAAGMAVLSAGVVLGMYSLMWSSLSREKQSSYWGDKYGVFYRPQKHGDSAVVWYSKQYAAIAQVPGSRRSLFSTDVLPPSVVPALRSVDRLLWLGLHLIGLGVMVRQRRLREALLFLSPTLVCAVFNLLGYWPFGVFRTNLFLLAGMSAIAPLALERKQPPKHAWASLLPVALLVLLPVFISRHDWGMSKQLAISSKVPQIIEQLLALEETQGIKREPFLLEHHSYNVFRYYVRHHARAPEWSASIDRKFKWKYYGKPKDVVRAARSLRPNQRAWVMLLAKHSLPANLRPRVVVKTRRHVLYTVQGPERR